VLENLAPTKRLLRLAQLSSQLNQAARRAAAQQQVGGETQFSRNF
jgi:hypothetical protein